MVCATGIDGVRERTGRCAPPGVSVCVTGRRGVRDRTDHCHSTGGRYSFSHKDLFPTSTALRRPRAAGRQTAAARRAHGAASPGARARRPRPGARTVYSRAPRRQLPLTRRMGARILSAPGCHDDERWRPPLVWSVPAGSRRAPADVRQRRCQPRHAPTRSALPAGLASRTGVHQGHRDSARVGRTGRRQRQSQQRHR